VLNTESVLCPLQIVACKPPVPQQPSPLPVLLYLELHACVLSI